MHNEVSQSIVVVVIVFYVIDWSPNTVKTNNKVVGHSQKNRVFESGHLLKARWLLTTESLFTGFSMLTKYRFCFGY